MRNRDESEEIWNGNFYGNKYNPPDTDILKDNVKTCWGWFFPGDWEDEPACYIDIYFDSEGRDEIILDYSKKICLHSFQNGTMENN